MAPEVFMKSESSGHGRAADIWSVGCCVIEMASGRRPWSDYDSNYQIMFKVCDSNHASLQNVYLLHCFILCINSFRWGWVKLQHCPKIFPLKEIT